MGELQRGLVSESKVISPEHKQCFFGYYDLNAYDISDQFHLCNSSGFIDRLPKKEDKLELGYIRLQTGEYHRFAETTAWNFQQGALLQWYGGKPDSVIYNIRGGDNEYQTVIHQLTTGERRYTDRATACVSPDGKYGLSLNFSRIYDFRPGYGYDGPEDPFYDVPQPERDGIYIVDMKTGISKLLLSYPDMLQELPANSMKETKFVVNHITFSPDSKRFLFLLRNFVIGENEWKTTLLTSDLSGNIYSLLQNTYVSHYYWKNERQILAHCSPLNKKGLFLLDDRSHDFVELKSPYFQADIHCIYSPDQKYIIGDAYPIEDEYRTLYLYNPENERTEVLLRDWSVRPECIDIRCDLHARWNRCGNKISFDSTCHGKREICEIDVSGISI